MLDLVSRAIAEENRADELAAFRLVEPTLKRLHEVRIRHRLQRSDLGRFTHRAAPSSKSSTPSPFAVPSNTLALSASLSASVAVSGSAVAVQPWPACAFRWLRRARRLSRRVSWVWVGVTGAVR
jgi:hypothetical protein